MSDTPNRRNGDRGRREGDDGFSLADVDELLTAREPRTRLMIREEIKASLSDGGGDMIRDSVREATGPTEKRVDDHQLVLRGEPGLFAGLVDLNAQHATAIASLLDLVKGGRIVLKFGKVVLALAGLGGAAQIADFLAGLGG